MSMYEQMASTEARSSYVYLGVGDYVVSVLEIKHQVSELKFIIEAEIVEARPVPMPGGGQPQAVHQPGDKVSWLVNYGGTKEQRAMALGDIRGFNDALIASAGGNATTWTQQQWEDFGSRCGKAANVAGLRLKARATQYVKKSGELGKIPRVGWSSIAGQPRRPDLVDVYGASVAAAKQASSQPPAPRSGPPKAGAPAKHPMHAECVDALRGFLASGEPTGQGSEIHKWAAGEGMSEAQYAAALAEAGA